MTSRRTALILALVSIALGALFRLQFVMRSDFGPSDLAYYESTPYGVDLPDSYGDSPYWLAWTRGDGQAYVTIAADPSAQGPVRGLSIALYRYARAGYSLAALLLVLGNASLIPYGLFAVNLIALGTLGWIAGHHFRRWGPRALLLVAVPGALVATATDTAEALGIALATVAVVASTRAAFAAAAALGIVRPDLASTLFLRGRTSPLLVGTTAVTAIGIRVVGMALGLEYAGLNNNLTLPFLGYLDVLGTQPVLDTAVTLGLAVVAVSTTIHSVRDEHGWRRLAFFGTGLFVLMLSPLVLGSYHNSLRAASGLSLLWAVPPVPGPDDPESTPRGKQKPTSRLGSLHRR